MNLELAALWLVRVVGVYCVAGFFFAVAFVLHGVERIDRGAKGATWGFRLIILPASVALWPWLLRRWLAATGEPPVERNAHRRVARAGGGAP